MSDTDRKSGSNTEGRNPDGTFAEGNSGKPCGARHKVTRAVEELLEGQAEALTEKAVELALQGDMTALRVCLERVVPARKDAPVNFGLPQMQSAADAAEGAASVLTAVSDGELTPAEGAQVMGLIDSYRRTLETTELEARIAKLEEQNS